MKNDITNLAQAGRLLRILGWINLIIAVLLTTLYAGFIFYGMADGLGIFLAAIIFMYLISGAYLVIGGLLKKDRARGAGLALAILSLFSFPIGTLIGALVLFYLIRGWQEPVTGMQKSVLNEQESEAKMEHKRSIGATFWGWAFIIANILSLFSLIISLMFQSQPQLDIMVMRTINVILAISYIICGIFILNLNEIARKSAIVLSIIGILLIPAQLTLLFKNMTSEESYARQKKIFTENLKPEDQQQALKNIEESNKYTKTNGPIFLILAGGVPSLIIYLIPIFFFTRPKVKEQFRRTIEAV